ncbi:MAG: hypothetical protein K2R98_12245 [Gemmataceae bacterium]|nr:hypothetical protein [Gemmataceae bacterium]
MRQFFKLVLDGGSLSGAILDQGVELGAGLIGLSGSPQARCCADATAHGHIILACCDEVVGQHKLQMCGSQEVPGCLTRSPLISANMPRCTSRDFTVTSMSLPAAPTMDITHSSQLKVERRGRTKATEQAPRRRDDFFPQQTRVHGRQIDKTAGQ